MKFTAWAYQVIVQSLPKTFENKLNFAVSRLEEEITVFQLSGTVILTLPSNQES